MLVRCSRMMIVGSMDEGAARLESVLRRKRRKSGDGAGVGVLPIVECGLH